MQSKGFSVVIASVLLVAVAITTSVVAYLWGVGLLTESLQGADVSGLSRADISIDSVDYGNDVLYVRCKQSETQLQTVYVTAPTTDAVTKVDLNTSRSGTSCAVGDSNVLDLNLKTNSPDITTAGADINAGFKVEIRGTNSAHAIETA